jgi:hypothetical protein
MQSTYAAQRQTSTSRAARLYVLATCLLLGGELNAILDERCAARDETSAPST